MITIVGPTCPFSRASRYFFLILRTVEFGTLNFLEALVLPFSAAQRPISALCSRVYDMLRLANRVLFLGRVSPSEPAC